jgi:hypothetical protein
LLPRKIPDENKWIWYLIQDIEEFMNEAVEPLQEYKKSWGEYLDLLRMDPDEFARKIEMDDNPWELDQIQS